jgi:hypothetical protein
MILFDLQYCRIRNGRSTAAPPLGATRLLARLEKTPHPNSPPPLPSPQGRGKRERGDRVRGPFWLRRRRTALPRSQPGPSLGLCIPPRRWSPDSIGAPPRRASQVPGLICLRAPSPTTPRSRAASRAPCFTTSIGFRPHWKTDHFPFALTRPKWVVATATVMARGFAARGFVQRNYSRPRSIGHLWNGQLQGKPPFSLHDQTRFILARPMSAPPALRRMLNRSCRSV